MKIGNGFIGGEAKITDGEIKVVKPSFIFSSKPETAALELIDGAYEIVEMWKVESPWQSKWKEEWLRKARELGANPE